MGIQGPVRRVAREARLFVSRALPQGEERLESDAADYWSGPDVSVAANSHWRSNPAFSTQVWQGIGASHWAMFEDFSRHEGREPEPGRVLEWGCGGGANAIEFAPRATEFVGVEVSAQSLAECDRQVRAVGAGPITPVLIDLADPELAVPRVGEVDLFLCTYVMELVPSADYAVRLLHIARQVMSERALAIVQIKYRTRAPATAGSRRSYRRNLTSMTTFAIDEFWTLCESVGLSPSYVILVQRNALDERYAYFFLRRGQSAGL